MIGAGLGGLAAAARLARLRHEVLVVERTDTVGGRLRPWVAGRRVVVPDDGFTLPAALRDLFLKTGKAIETVLDLQPVDVVARHRFAEGTELVLPATDPAAAAAAVTQALGEQAGAEWSQLMAGSEQVWHAVRGPLLESPAATGPAPARPRTRRSKGLVGRAVRDERLRALLDHYAAAAGFTGPAAPPTAALLPYLEQTFRVWRVEGGLGRLVEAVHDRALDRGVVVVTGVTVTAVTTVAGRVETVRLDDGRVLPADVVVADVGPQAVDGLLGAPRSRAAVRSTRQLLVRRPLLDASEPVVFYGANDVTARAGAGTDGVRALTAWGPHGLAPDVEEVLAVLSLHGYDVERASVVADRVVTGASEEPPSRRLLRRSGRRSGCAGLFTVGRSAAFGTGVPFVTMSAAAVAERIGRA